MQTSEKTVAVTGASGYIGSRLLQTLEDEDGLGKLVAIDNRPLTSPVHNVAGYRQDVKEPIDDILRQHRVTTLVHLAFDGRRGRNRREIGAVRRANLDALREVLDSCAQARVRHIIYLSSHTVYGAHPNNPFPVTTRAPLRPLPDFPYGYDKLLSEQTIQKFAEEHQETTVTVLRPCAVVGPTGGNAPARVLHRRWLPGVLGYNPPFQFLYEDDLARVLAVIIKMGLPGTYNVAGEGVVFYNEMASIIGCRMVTLPAFLAYPVTQLTWNLGLQRDFTASGLDFMRYSMVLDTGDLRQMTGYRFWHTSMEALSAFAGSVLFR